MIDANAHFSESSRRIISQQKTLALMNTDFLFQGHVQLSCSPSSKKSRQWLEGAPGNDSDFIGFLEKKTFRLVPLYANSWIRHCKKFTGESRKYDFLPLLLS